METDFRSIGHIKHNWCVCFQDMLEILGAKVPQRWRAKNWNMIALVLFQMTGCIIESPLFLLERVNITATVYTGSTPVLLAAASTAA